MQKFWCTLKSRTRTYRVKPFEMDGTEVAERIWTKIAIQPGSTWNLWGKVIKYPLLICDSLFRRSIGSLNPPRSHRCDVPRSTGVTGSSASSLIRIQYRKILSNYSHNDLMNWQQSGITGIGCNLSEIQCILMKIYFTAHQFL